MSGLYLLSTAGTSPALLIVCPILIAFFATINLVNGGMLTFGLYSYGPPFQLITTNLASIVFALLVIILNRMWKTPYHKAMIGASLFLTYLQLMSAMMYGGICQLNVSIYIEQVLYAAQASTGDVCRVNDCENQLMSQISGIVQGILSLKNQPNEVLAVVISVFSFLTHVVASVMLITREKAAASESDDVTTPPTSDQVPTTTQADRPKMDYSDL